MGRKADQDDRGRAGGEARHIHLPARLDAELERHHRVQNVRLQLLNFSNRDANNPLRFDLFPMQFLFYGCRLVTACYR